MIEKTVLHIVKVSESYIIAIFFLSTKLAGQVDRFCFNILASF